MKRILLLIIKIGLFVFFIYNLDINIDLNKESNNRIIRENYQEDINWLKEKYNCAQKLGVQYSPELYFKDIAEIQLKRKANGFDYRAELFITNTQTKLASIFHDNIFNNRINMEANEYDSFMARITPLQEKYQDLVNPGKREKDARQFLKMHEASYWLDIAHSFLTWLFKQYIKNFFLALILLWLWWYEEKGSLKIRNPFSFLFCILIYPIVIIRAWSEMIKNSSRYLVMSVEYRRHQKDLFALFSEDEISELKRVAKSKINLTEYQEQLKLQGLTVKHSFIPALVVSIIFIALPQSQLMADNDNSVNENLCFKVAKEVPPDIGAYQYSDSMHFDKLASLCDKIEVPVFIQTLVGRIRVFDEKCLDGYGRRLKTIPLLVNNYFNKFLKSIINQKRENEKVYCFNRYVFNGFCLCRAG